MQQNTKMKLLVVMISTKIPLRICEDMCKTSVEAVNAKDVTNKKEFANRKRPTNC